MLLPMWERVGLLEKGKDTLIVVDGMRIYVPESMRKEILNSYTSHTKES